MIAHKLASMVLCCVLGGMLAGCDRDGSGAASDSAASPSQTSTAPPARLASRLTVEQVIAGSTASWFTLQEDGVWQCDRCRGHAATASGQLEPAQMETLFALLTDPALTQESKAQKGVRKSNCNHQIESTLTYADLTILWSDCPGNVPPPVTAKVVDLLAGATTLAAETP